MQAIKKSSLPKIAIALTILAVVGVISLFVKEKTPSDEVIVYVAASMTNAINDINKLYETRYHTHIKTSYAASSTLAKQIEQGATADIFISADTAWMDYLVQKNLVTKSNTQHLLGNTLVIIAPKNIPFNTSIRFEPSFNIGSALTGKLCTGNTNSVPVGKYAKQALHNLGWWEKIQPKLVETEDVRSALTFVDRGECQLGIVYATDAKISKNSQIVGTFPLTTHTPIVYPIGLVKQNAETQRYYQFLQSPQAKAIYQQYGFSVL